MKQRKLLWCGEGDLNPHEIAPASTSIYYRGCGGMTPSDFSIACEFGPSRE